MLVLPYRLISLYLTALFIVFEISTAAYYQLQMNICVWSISGCFVTGKKTFELTVSQFEL